MTLKEDLENVSHNIGYLYTPGSHHTTTRIIPATRLFSNVHKNRLSHGKNVLKTKLNELQKTKKMILKEHLPRNRNMKLLDVRLKYNLPYIYRRELKLHDTLMAREFEKVQSVIVWNFRAILDRIGELDRPGSFMDIYIKNGPICSTKPMKLERGESVEKKVAYRDEKKRWEKDNKKGFAALRNLEIHVHQIYFASKQMDVLFNIYQTYLDLYGQKRSDKFNDIYRISKWICDRYTILENHLKIATKCNATENALFHETLQVWGTNKNYKLLKSFLLKKYVGFYNKNEQLRYLEQINSVNKHL
ncbi:hypothetical protein PBCV1_A243R [Paramecium bursaria Chlorella virus 1]|uniref:Uncharacterized protein n=1 Tax=Paramecium bursaria Chlorella virus 1 TaxID=10506 RepID=Q84563_PBCV1|nr:hypothetical protein PBCV1_A243R [Paramecium bursaria Chlorella virus 1]AAC96611.1 hypothetical protein [Paramecium bursaria Chlorella virus 1]